MKREVALLILIVIPGMLLAQRAADFQKNYPRSAELLLNSMDWEHANLKGIKKAENAETLEALAQYIKNSSESITKQQYEVKPIDTGRSDRAIERLQNSPKKEGGYLNFSVNPEVIMVDINRFGFVKEVLRSYHTGNNEKYHDALKWIMNDLVLGQPPVYHPTEADRWAESCWISLNTAIRMASLNEIILGYVQHPKMESELLLLLLSSTFEHAAFIQNHGQTHAGNWMTTESEELMKTALLFPENKNSSAWSKTASDRFLSNYHESFLEDGSQCELSVHYGYIAFESAWNFYKLMEEAKVEIPEYYRESLEQQMRFYAWNCNPDGEFVPTGDSEGENQGIYGFRHNRGKYVQEINIPEVLYLYTKGEKGDVPQGPSSRVFDRSGHAISRDTVGPDNTQFSLFDMDIYGTGHVHHDALQLAVYNKRRILVDPGRYHYTLYDGWMEGYFKAARGHNTVSIDGCDQFFPYWKVRDEEIMKYYKSRALEPIDTACYQITPEYDFFRGITPNGYIEEDAQGKGFGRRLGGKNAHERGVYYKRGEYWVVLDRIFTDAERDITTFWHFHPEVTHVSIDTHGILLTNDPDEGNLMIVPLQGNVKPSGKLFKGSTEPKQGWYAPTYGKMTESWAAEYYSQGSSLIWMGWLIIPFDSNEVPEVTNARMVGMNHNVYNIIFTINGEPEEFNLQMGETPQFEEDIYYEGLLPKYVIKRD